MRESSEMTGWVAEMLFMIILACNRPHIAEYEVYWPMGFQLINP